MPEDDDDDDEGGDSDRDRDRDNLKQHLHVLATGRGPAASRSSPHRSPHLRVSVCTQLLCGCGCRCDLHLAPFSSIRPPTAPLPTLAPDPDPNPPRLLFFSCALELCITYSVMPSVCCSWHLLLCLLHHPRTLRSLTSNSQHTAPGDRRGYEVVCISTCTSL